MKTLISIIENSPGEKSSFGTALSKKTGIPVYDLSTYNAKYGTNSKAWSMMLTEIGLKETVIFNNANQSDALKLSKSFGKTIVFLPMGENNKLTHRWIGVISRGSTSLKSPIVTPESVKINAEIINQINPVLILSEDYLHRENYWIWRITESLKK